MQCPICGSDRNPKDVKCPTCGVDFSKWLSKVIKKLNKKTHQVMQDAKPKKIIDLDEPVSPNRYKEIIKQDE